MSHDRNETFLEQIWIKTYGMTNCILSMVPEDDDNQCGDRKNRIETQLGAFTGWSLCHVIDW